MSSALAYGLLCIALSFGVGSLGTVLQAGMSLSGSINGPIFGLFSMALLLRYINAKGAITGFVCGLCVALSISMGAFAHPRPKVALSTSYSNCSTQIFDLYLANGKADLIPATKFIPYYENPT